MSRRDYITAWHRVSTVFNKYSWKIYCHFFGASKCCAALRVRRNFLFPFSGFTMWFSYARSAIKRCDTVCESAL